MPSLDGPFVKADRALAQIYALNGEINQFRARVYANANPTRLKRDPKTGEYSVLLNPVDDPPAEWSAWIGEIFHDMRSALDHLVWQLASVTAGDVDPTKPLDPWREELQFPILYRAKPKKFEIAIKNRLNNVPAVAKDRIRDVQPYVVTPNQPERDRLARLARMSNIDKHQTLHVLTHYITPTQGPIIELEPTDYSITARWDRPAGPVTADEVLMRFSGSAAGPNPKVKVKPHIIPDVAFDELSPMEGTDFLTIIWLWTGMYEILCSFQDLLPVTGQRRVPPVQVFDKRLMVPNWPEQQPTPVA